MDKTPIITIRNLLYEDLKIFTANQTIDAKIQALLELLLEKAPNLSFEIRQENQNIELKIYDSEKDITITEISQRIYLYAELLKLIYRIKYKAPFLCELSSRRIFTPTRIETF